MSLSTQAISQSRAAHSNAISVINGPMSSGLATPTGLMLRVVNSSTRLSLVHSLVRQRYLDRGLQAPGLRSCPEHSSLTLCVDTSEGQVHGTVTINVDGPPGLLCQRTYPDEVGRLRLSGERLCEITALAVEECVGSAALSLATRCMVRASMFHVCHIYAKLHGVTYFMIEVHPRHAPYYVSSLGCRQIGEEKTCERVNAPAVLLQLSAQHVQTQIDRLAGQRDARRIRSLYPYFYSPAEALEVSRRLMETLGYGGSA